MSDGGGDGSGGEYRHRPVMSLSHLTYVEDKHLHSRGVFFILSSN